MSDFTQKRIELVKNYIANVSLDKSSYKVFNVIHFLIALLRGSLIRCAGLKNNQILFKTSTKKRKVDIKFDKTSRNNRVYMGDDFAGKFRLRIKGSNCIVYIGNNVQMGGVLVEIHESETVVAIGNDLRTGPGCSFYCLEKESGFIVGDDCMISTGGSFRSTDGHSIMDANSHQQINKAVSPIILEPHVWLGENVTVMKNTKIGSGSIVGATSTVAKNIPRYSAAVGVPAKPKNKKPVTWSETNSTKDVESAKYFQGKFPADGAM